MRSELTDAQRTAQIIRLLQIRHSEPEWATFVELRNSTGFPGQVRYIDAFALNCYPSKSFLRVAYEVKVSRGDFLKELADPRKRQFAEKVANQCYFAAPAGMINPDELPDGWGLIQQTDKCLRIRRGAATREAEMPLGFVAAIARRTADPKPELAEVAWLRAGQEINESDLKKMTNETIRKQLWIEHERAILQFRKGAEFQTLKRATELLEKYCGASRYDLHTLEMRLRELDKGQL